MPLTDAEQWAPAEKVLPPTLMNHLMFMGTRTHGRTTIYQYKHKTTRRYISLDRHGQAWQLATRPGNPADVAARRICIDEAIGWVTA